MIDKKFIGYEVPPTLWDVEKWRIRFFAEVIGATDPIYLDTAAAKAAGYRNVVAPPTFICGDRFIVTSQPPGIVRMFGSVWPDV